MPKTYSASEDYKPVEPKGNTFKKFWDNKSILRLLKMLAVNIKDRMYTIQEGNGKMRLAHNMN